MRAATEIGGRAAARARAFCATPLRAFGISPGTRYRPPDHVRQALEVVLDEPDIASIEVLFRPMYVRCHLFFIGCRTGSVTRPERIYTNIPEDVFFALDRHVLHEYYHVVQQWRRERMSRAGYLLNSRRREDAAEKFAAASLASYRRLRREHAARAADLAKREA